MAVSTPSTTNNNASDVGEVLHFVEDNLSDAEENRYMMSIVNISATTPLNWAIPLYGHLMPALVCITAVTNSFIMLVLYQKHLRTPTNMVLFSMALTDLLTGLTSFPWFFYYYTLKGYQTDILYGMTPFWCKAHAYMADSLPSMLHNSAIWLTVFLAVQRYVYVCTPSVVNRYCTPRNTKIVIVCIFITSFVFTLPEIISKRRFSLRISDRRECYVQIVPWVMKLMTRDMYYSCLYWSRVTLHGVPCILILIFTYKLAKTLRQAEIRKKSWAILQGENDRKTSYSSAFSRLSVSSGRSLYATNRMLAVICTVFLLLEIPATLIYGIQIIVANRLVERSPTHYVILNRLLVMRNLLIVMASPIEFAIYCSMSEQFRLTVRQLFSSKLLFVAQAQATFHGGKRYSLILVDVEEIERQKDSTASRFSRLLGSFKTGREVQPRRKVARQSSFPNNSPEIIALRRNGNVSGSFRQPKPHSKLNIALYRNSNSQLRVPSTELTTQNSASSF